MLIFSVKQYKTILHITHREPATEESKMVTSWYVVRFFAIALNDKVDMNKKHKQSYTLRLYFPAFANSNDRYKML